ncbi:hypothetical protein PT974_02935 [Cladobotryum mycophilum]|uniref:BTB domain-containing protein n=1 Tax=Cladobotryum mycophilum TaxID=491253 RepID=A0ABR0SZI3_9HYPO
MASITWDTILASDQFKFIVGRERAEFTVHSAVIASQSAALEKLVNNGMKESQERCVVWDEVDVATFTRFCQFAYTGTYTSTGPRKRPDYVKPEGPQPPPAVRQLNDLAQRRNPDANRCFQLWKAFQSLHPSSVKTLSGKNKPDDDFTPFLSHARLYVLAECYGIDSLGQMALRTLRLHLQELTLYSETTDECLELIKYCYDNTVEGEGKADALRHLLNLHAACNLEQFWKNPEFRALMRDNEEFSEGVMNLLMKRLD